MPDLISEVIPALKILQIIGDVDDFHQWLSKHHPESNTTDLFEGYNFAIRCCVNSFAHGIANEEELQIKSDLLTDRAIAEWVPVNKIENSCPKAIFLKNLKPHIRNILTAKNYDEVKTKISEFETAIITRFNLIFDNCIIISPKLKIDRIVAINLWLIDYVHTYLMQIEGNGPLANWESILSPDRMKKARELNYLEGYKYIIQFLWYKLLEGGYYKTSLIKMHEADSWKTYKYIPREKSEDPIENLFVDQFNLEEQACFDSFFYHIKNEITDPLEKKYGFPIYTIDSYLKLKKGLYKRDFYFEDLLNKEGLVDPFDKLSWEDKILNRLYWDYSIEVIQTRESHMHFGIPSFNTMLAGTVALHNKAQSPFKKIQVVKFIHPHDKESTQNDFSYGILIDTKSAAGYYSDGWVIYLNACGDYSGFSGSEYRSSEKLIKQYKKDGKIEIRELAIPLKEFEKFIHPHMKSEDFITVLNKNKLMAEIIQKSRAYLFELFSYYIHSIYYAKKYKIEMNVDRKSDEKDLVLTSDDEVILVECKLNPQNYDLNRIIDVLERKLAKYDKPKKSVQMWFWEELSEQNERILRARNVQVVVVKEKSKANILAGISLKQLNFIMQDYQK